MNKSQIGVAAIFLALAVLLGAFGSHALKPYLSTYGKSIYQTASLYHFIHAIGLLCIANLSPSPKEKHNTERAYKALVYGIIFFSGSLYLLALNDRLNFLPNWFGVFTPIGGIFFLLGWILVAFTFFKKSKK